MDLRGTAERQLRRWEMFESCGVQDGAGGIQVCGPLLRHAASFQGEIKVLS